MWMSASDAPRSIASAWLRTSSRTRPVRLAPSSTTSRTSSRTPSAKRARASQRRSTSERLSDAHVDLPGRVAVPPLQREAEVEPDRADRALVAEAGTDAVLEIPERE